jgi:hypothetical protein
VVVVVENGTSSGAVAEDFGEEGSLVVEDQRFAVVPGWVITAEVSDAAFRAYSMLLRFGDTSGCRMPSRGAARSEAAPLGRLGRPGSARARVGRDDPCRAAPLRAAILVQLLLRPYDAGVPRVAPT